METTPTDIKFCACAFIDLLGFSSHIEVSSDLRTNIGQQAIKRLSHLENVIRFIDDEKKTSPQHYPKNFGIKRINDALVLTLDLPEELLPEIGQAARNSAGSKIMQAIVEKIGDDTEDSDVILNEYVKLLWEKTSELRLFMGLVARIFNYISKKENDYFFPGAKGVVCSGYRAPFIYDGTEDVLSANFAFSNAYKAETALKGTGLYIDNHLLQLLSVTQVSRNLLRRSLLIKKDDSFDPAQTYEDLLFIPSTLEYPLPQSIQLFRKNYLFRKTNSKRLALFQIIDYLLPFINGEARPDKEAIFSPALKSLKDEMSIDDLQKEDASGLNLVYLDVEHDLRLAKGNFAESDPEFLSEYNAEKRRKIIESFFVDTMKSR